MAKKKTGKELSRQFRKDYKKTNEKLEKLIAGELAQTETNPIVPFKRIPDKEIIKSYSKQDTAILLSRPKTLESAPYLTLSANESP